VRGNSSEIFNSEAAVFVSFDRFDGACDAVEFFVSGMEDETGVFYKDRNTGQ
jgi:hypothetical protein